MDIKISLCENRFVIILVDEFNTFTYPIPPALIPVAKNLIGHIITCTLENYIQNNK